MVGTVAALTVLGSIIAAGWDDGHPAEQVRMLSGAAWLPSAQVGQLTLLDGASAEVAARVRIATTPPRDLDMVQHGATAYAVNRSDGSLSRIDGATFEVTAPATPIPDAKQEFSVFAGPDALYALDAERGLLATLDPMSLATRGSLLSLAAQVTPHTAMLDDTGRLWVLDTTTGDVTWIKDGRSETRRQVTQPGSGMLVLAGGSPVLIDVQGRTVTTLAPDTGDVKNTIELGLRPDDKIQVGGSSHTPHVYLTSSQGTLVTCDLTATACTTPTPLTVDAELGTPVEAGGRVFVPDYTSGQVWIVDPEQNHVVATPQVMSPPTRFQLLTRDGIVFFNDPSSERAGVVRLDGGVVHVPKYDPRNPGQGLSTTQPIGSQGSRSPSQATTGPTPTSTPISPADIPPGVRIVVSKSRPRVGEDIALRATAESGPDPVSAHWAFGDGQESHDLRTAHHWDTAQTYQVTVRVTFPHGHTAVVSQPIQVTSTPKRALTVTTIGSGSGTVNSQPAGVSCPPTCTANFAEGTTVQLAGTAAKGSVFVGWSGGDRTCTGITCQLTMPANAINVTASFRTLAATSPDPFPTRPPSGRPTPTPPPPSVLIPAPRPSGRPDPTPSSSEPPPSPTSGPIFSPEPSEPSSTPDPTPTAPRTTDPPPTTSRTTDPPPTTDFPGGGG